jgi:hypothetical protein
VVEEQEVDSVMQIEQERVSEENVNDDGDRWYGMISIVEHLVGGDNRKAKTSVVHGDDEGKIVRDDGHGGNEDDQESCRVA